jgi:peptidoglycan-associated lipoprotein
MLVPVKGAVVIVAALSLSGCLATKGALEKATAEQRAALDAERAERVSADERLAADLASLRNDLQAMKTEFGAKISAVENGLQFAMPVHFAFDDSNVQSSDQSALDRFADIVTKYYTGATVTVEGFADPAGTQAYNKRLSTQRAESVRSYLMTRNISAQVRSVGYGEERLVVADAAKDEPGAELNRRVVFVIESPKAQAAQITAVLN